MKSKNKKLKKPSANLKPGNKGVWEVFRIDWEDHFSGNHAWVQDPQELNTKPYICVSVGVLVKDDGKTITLAQNMGTNEQIADTITILKNCVIFKKKLGEIIYGTKEG